MAALIGPLACIRGLSNYQILEHLYRPFIRTTTRPCEMWHLWHILLIFDHYLKILLKSYILNFL